MIARLARITHKTLKRIMVGRVFFVDVQIKAKLEIIAKIYNHQKQKAQGESFEKKNLIIFLPLL
jgi:hypothetical protein